MRRGPKPAKSKVEAKPSVERKSPKDDGAMVRDLEKRLAEAREQQTATAEILRVISSSPTDLQPVFNTIVQSGLQLLGGYSAVMLLVQDDQFHLAAYTSTGTQGDDSVTRLFPIPTQEQPQVWRAVLEKRPVVVEDAETEPGFTEAMREMSRARGWRSSLQMPMMRDNNVIGLLNITRQDPGSFASDEIALLGTFGAQAVIAIENVRLFTELQTSNRELRTALDTQTATSDILRVISQSQTDVQPVFDAILSSAVRLLAGYTGLVTRIAGDQIELAALTSTDVAGDAAVRATFPRSLHSEDGYAQAIRTRTPLNIADAHTDSRWPEDWRASARIRGYRSGVVVPLLRHAEPIGAIAVSRREPGGFTDDEIALLQTFADQAVIAIENVRLFNETKEALEQQTATSDILRVISQSPTDIQPVFDTVVESAARLCEANDVSIYRRDGDWLRFVAHHGSIPPPGPVGEYFRPLERGSLTARSVLEGQMLHVADLQAETEEFPTGSDLARRLGFRTLLTVPLMQEGAAIGTIMVRRTEVRLFTERQVALLQTFADQAVIAIENVRLFNELQEKNRALTAAHTQVTEALERQTATSEILRVIASSPTDVQPVFDAIARNAVALCGGIGALVLRFDGEMLHVAGHHAMSPERVEQNERAFPRRPGRDYPPGRAFLDRSVVHVPDLQAATEFAASTARQRGAGSQLAVPLLHGQAAIGVIGLARNVVGPFSAQQIEVLQTFADQAVIAIENVRLFKELQTSNRELTAALDTQTATSDILRVISRSQTDVQPVFDAIVASAVRLLHGYYGMMTRVDDDRLERVAVTSATGAEDPAVRASFPQPLHGESVHARAIRDRAPINIADALTDPRVSEERRAIARAIGFRSLAVVPLLRYDEPLGSIAVTRHGSGGFTNDEIALLQTFADQAVIAIENVRMFTELKERNREVEQKSRELAAASQHKSEFLANMSHELRTPLNAIIGFSEVLGERMFGELNEKQEEYLKDIHASGQHLLSLINDILDLSKIEAGRMELELSDFHLPTALDNALTLVRERAGRRSVALHLSVDERLGEIQADERKVRQVVLNLLSNAIKFTPEGGRIEVAAVPKDGLVEVSVTDTGVGIAPEDHEAVFEEFRQVGTADKKVEGTGLGLTLCRKFVELHGGRIWVKSEVGVGSTFTFTLPMRHGE